MKPQLYSEDPDKRARSEHLNKKREEYQLDFSYYGFGLPVKVPKRDSFSVTYLAKAMELKAKIAANYAACGLIADFERVHDTIFQLFGEDSADKFNEHLARARATITGATKRTQPLSIDEYQGIFRLLAAPRSVKLWNEDWYFARDRLAGFCPHEIARVNGRLPDSLPVTNTHYQKSFPTDTLEAALAEGRLFYTTYPVLDGLDIGPPPGSTIRYYLTAPMVLFAVPPVGAPDRRLMPVAIQLAQKPGPQAPIFTPADGMAWRMAKTAAQIADRNKHGIAWHGARMHFLSGAIVVCTERALPDSHPVSILLRPHFEFTLAIVEATKEGILNPKGLTPKLQSPSFEGVVELMHRGLDSFVWHDHMPKHVFKHRGVDDRESLPDYPYRDDAEPIWEATHRFVASYLRLYYASDEQLAEDPEIRAWRASLAAKDGASIQGLPAATTIDGLTDLVAELIYVLTTLHSSINYGVYEATAFEPHTPGAQYGPAPTEIRDYSEEDLLAMFPPLELTMESFSDVYFVSNMRCNQLGQYPPRQFEDPRVIPILHEFQRRLEEIEEEIRVRNDNRPVPYLLLLPSNITASLCA